MSTVREIAQRAARRLGVQGSGETLDADAADDALACVSGFLLQAVSQCAEPGLTRVLISDAYTAGEDELIAADENGPYTITLPVTVTDSRTGETRAPKNFSVVMIAGTTPQVFIYDEAYGDWQDIGSLALTDYCPLSTLNGEHLSAAVAGYMADEYGREMSPVLLGMAASGASWVRARLRKSRRVAVDLPLLRPNRACAR